MPVMGGMKDESTQKPSNPMERHRNAQVQSASVNQSFRANTKNQTPPSLTRNLLGRGMALTNKWRFPLCSQITGSNHQPPNQAL